MNIKELRAHRKELFRERFFTVNQILGVKPVSRKKDISLRRKRPSSKSRALRGTLVYVKMSESKYNADGTLRRK